MTIHILFQRKIKLFFIYKHMFIERFLYIHWSFPKYFLIGYILQCLAIHSSLYPNYSSLIFLPNSHWYDWATDEMHCAIPFNEFYVR